jgi:hypothetical protein
VLEKLTIYSSLPAAPVCPPIPLEGSASRSQVTRRDRNWHVRVLTQSQGWQQWRLDHLLTNELPAIRKAGVYHSTRPPIWITRAPPVFPCVRPLVMMPALAALLSVRPGLLGLKMLKTLMASPRIWSFVLS